MKIWKTITFDDLKTYLFEPQLQALMQYMTTPGEPHHLNTIIEDTLSRVRAEVHGIIKNPLDDDHRTIPPEVRMAAAYLVIEAIQARVPGFSLTPEQKENAKNARELLRRISKGEVPVLPPTNRANALYEDLAFFEKYPPVSYLKNNRLKVRRENLGVL